MLEKIRNYFFPVIDDEVRELMDKNSTRNIERISIVVAIFESITLTLFVVTRKSLGRNEWISIYSVLFCIVTCLVGFFATRALLKKPSMNHLQVVAVNASYYMLMSIWAVLASYRRYQEGEQILTFYAVEIMLVCFIVFKPWVSAIATLFSYGFLYAFLYRIDGAAGIHVINYCVLMIVSVTGMVIRFHSLLRASRAVVQLEKAKDMEIQDKVNILQAIADIYDQVNLIDFIEGTEISVRDKDPVRRSIDLGSQNHTALSRRLREKIMPDQLEDFIEYTNISTVRSRLAGKKLLSKDFVDMGEGWFRAQYIPVEVDENGIPTQIVFTTRNVNGEKMREEHLIRIAMTDELTRLFNRRSYEEDLNKEIEKGLDKDFVILSADVNGLKMVNDTKGHAGGDELIKGAAECLLMAIGGKGKAYRTGGDEFVAILHTDDPKDICEDVETLAGRWRGKYSDKLSISIGYASYVDNPDMTVHQLEKKADDEMYQSKARYYETNGIDRRVHKR